MKICSAQIKPMKGDIDRNIEKHQEYIMRAVSYGADLIFFPELSLTGYEPALAKELVARQDDQRFNVFQQISDTKGITICVGVPTDDPSGVHISMIIFQPRQQRKIYSKQHLHSDELPYFVKGEHQLILEVNKKQLAPAICYESLLPEHVRNASTLGAEFYLASVAKSAKGIAKAFQHYPEVARQYSMPVLMSNCVGECDDFIGVGTSAIWNKKGELQVQLPETKEGILILDTETEEVIEWTV